MQARPQRSALDYFPPRVNYRSLAEAADHCKGCDIYKNATQAVFGEGDLHARLMFIGEQPGDVEDVAGHPFVGPAGKLFYRALADAGIDRSQAYLTNAVKHFKWKPAGKRRLHERPKAGEVAACRPWLEAEIALIKPETLVFLGATAAQSLLGSSFRVTKMRGVWLESELAKNVLATIHPSAVLRSPERDVMYHEFVNDLKLVAAKIV